MREGAIPNWLRSTHEPFAWVDENGMSLEAWLREGYNIHDTPSTLPFKDAL